jgi:hypothetical protein
MLAAKILATHAAGRGLCLVGGFRYRLLDGSARASLDLDYHWDGDLASKQTEIAEVLRGKLLPEVQRHVGLAGDVRLAAGPTADSAVVRTVELAFYHMAESGSRIEIPVDILGLARLDPPIVRTVEGTVFLTLMNRSMRQWRRTCAKPVVPKWFGTRSCHGCATCSSRPRRHNHESGCMAKLS